ncbi:unnamed protein product, partial [Effrenium voratum]
NMRSDPVVSEPVEARIRWTDPVTAREPVEVVIRWTDPVTAREPVEVVIRWREAQGADNRKHVQGFASLRLACCQMLERNAASGGSGIESWYKEDNLLTLAQKKGRAWSGISAMTEDEAESLGFKCSSGYDATRSAFTYRKDVKELLRGGLENGDFIRDYDMKASFPAAFLERHPSLLWVGRWVNGSFMDTAVQWCDEAGVTTLPEPLRMYWQEIRTGMGLDVERFPELARRLALSGREGQALRDAVCYVLNSESERRHLDSASQRIKRIAKVRCCELDGLVVERHPASTWEHIEEALGNRFAYKPYRPRAELLQTVAHAAGLEMHLALWPASFRWEEEEQYAIQCARRLKDPNCAPPVVWLARTLTTRLLQPGVLLRDKYKISPCAGKALDFFKSKVLPNGMVWELSHGQIDDELECDMVRALCSLTGVAELDAPDAFVTGSLTRNIANRLAQPLFDGRFLERVDGEDTWQLVTFACGTTLNIRTGEVGSASAQQCIKRHLDYAYPEEQLGAIAAKEQELGTSCLEVFREIVEWEGHPLNAEVAVYPESIRKKLELLTDEIPHLRFFQLMHNSFTPRYDPAECPQPEEHGGWQATVFRTMKALGACLGVSHENSVFDLGEEGDNGKGVLAAAFRSVFGGYYEELPVQVVSKDIPSGSAASPEVYRLQGARFLGTPESEKSIAIKSIWVKLLADQSTRWVARTLYKQEHEFRIPALFALSTNLKINFTSIDSGVRPRIQEDLKSGAFYTTELKAGMIHVATAAFQAFCTGGGGRLERQPAVIKRASQILLNSEYTEFMQMFLNESTQQCIGKEATPKVKLVAALKQYIGAQLPEEKLNATAFSQSLDALCTTKVPYGTTERLMLNITRKYVRLVGPP